MGKGWDWAIIQLADEPHHIGFMARWNKHCQTIHPISSHDAVIQLSHHIGFLYSHQLMICDSQLISASTSKIKQIAHRIPTANKRFKNTIRKSQTTFYDWPKWMKRCKTYQANRHNWRLNSNRLRGKRQIHTIIHKCHHEGKSAAIKQRNGKEMAI